MPFTQIAQIYDLISPHTMFAECRWSGPIGEILVAEGYHTCLQQSASRRSENRRLHVK